MPTVPSIVVNQQVKTIPIVHMKRSSICAVETQVDRSKALVYLFVRAFKVGHTGF